MQDGVAFLVLGTLLAGLVFLFLQGRQLRALLERLGTRLAALEEKTGGEGTEGAEPRDAPLSGLQEGLGRVESRLKGLGTPLEAIRNRLEAVETRMREAREAVPAPGREEGLAALEMRLEELLARLDREVAPWGEGAERPVRAPLREPDQVLREWLGLEGYTDCVVGEPEERPEGLRFPVRALRSGELRQGHVLLGGGRVVKARLEVPTRLFP